MIVALIALFAALGGTGYAALKLPKNSVSAKQIKKNAVTAAKIKKNAVNGAKVKKKSLTGSDINVAKLGTVPSAETANVANSVPPLEGTHLIGAPGEPAFESGATNFGSTSGINTQPAGFYKDHDGTVHLQGLIKTGPAVGAMFSLPAGFRPAPGTALFFNTFCSPQGPTAECLTDEEGDGQFYSQLLVAGANVIVPPFVFNGAVVGLAEEVAVSLDGVSFRAAG
jgi:hypothetical protein